MIKQPENVCINGSCLAWSPVECADGYNIHVDGEYHKTVYTHKTEIDREGVHSVSAFIKHNGQEIHTPRTIARPPHMFPCIVDAKNDAPQFVRDNYTLAFEDNFNQQNIDITKWNTAQPWGPNVITNNEDQYYPDVLGGDTSEPSPFSHDGQNLIITASPTTNGTNGQDYVSGVITTFGKFEWVYGYSEVCMWTPCDADGYWAAAWGYATDFSGDELDFAEVAQGTATWGQVFSLNQVAQAYHNPPQGDRIDSNGNIGTPTVDCNGNTLDAQNGFSLPSINCGQFNTYGLLRLADRTEFYVNGQMTNSICDPTLTPDTPMYLIINLAVGGNFVGTPDPADYPTELIVDYARVWVAP